MSPKERDFSKVNLLYSIYIHEIFHFVNNECRHVITRHTGPMLHNNVFEHIQTNVATNQFFNH